MFKKTLWASLVLFILSFSLSASTDHRYWKLPDGSRVHAAYTGLNEKTGLVSLRIQGGETIKVPLKDLGELDQTCVKKEFKIQNDLAVLLKKVHGTVEYWQTDGELATDFYVYFPSAYKKTKKLPLMILFNSSGRGARFLKRHIEAAESVGMILICSDHFKNHSDDEIAMTKFLELITKVRTDLPHDKNAVYLGGDSGGALRAYWYTYQVEGPWAGVYANGGWLQRKYDAPYIGGLRIAMVNGNKDSGANREAKKDKVVLRAAGNKLRLFIFEGGHQVASIPAQKRAFNWLLESKSSYEGMTDDLDSMRQTQIHQEKKFSTTKAIDAANRLSAYVDLTGKSKDAVLKLLGPPHTLNDFAVDYDHHDSEGSLIYTFQGLYEGSTWGIQFSEGKVSGQFMAPIIRK